MTESTQWIKIPEGVSIYCITCKKKLEYASTNQMCRECDREKQITDRGFSIQTFY